MVVVCVSLCGYTELLGVGRGQHVVQQVIDDVTHEHQKLLSELPPRSFSWNHMLFFRFSEARCVPTARAVASLFLPVFSPVWRWALKTKVLLHAVMLWVISETVGDGLLSALKGEWHDCGLLCCTKGGCSPIKSTHPQACTHMWELSGLLLSAQPGQCIILPIHVLCTWATVRFVVELSVNDQHQLPEAKQRAASGEANEWTELRPPDDKLNMEALQCLCLHSVLPCVPGNTFHNSTPHTQRGGMYRKEKKKEEKKGEEVAQRGETVKCVREALTTCDVSTHTRTQGLFLFVVFMP